VYLHKSKKDYLHQLPSLLPHIASESEVVHTRVQRASNLSCIKSVLHPEPSTSSSVFSSEKCNTAATNTKQHPKRAPLEPRVEPAFEQLHAMDIATTKERGLSALPSTKS
jgi:hypothetical protein